MVTAWCPHTQDHAISPIRNIEKVIAMPLHSAATHCHLEAKHPSEEVQEILN
jgi:hypothetical protein